MPVRYLFSTICFVLFFTGLSSDILAQRQIGVRWEVPDNSERAGRELEIFNELGITYLEVNSRLPSPVWKKINELGFNTFGALPVRFPLARTFSEPDSAFLKMMRGLITHYSSQKSVQAIGLFQYGPSQEEEFTDALLPYVQQIKEVHSGKLYYLAVQSNPSESDRLFDFKMIGIKADNNSNFGAKFSLTDDKVVYHYNPSDEIKPFLTPVKWFLEETSSARAPVFFNSQWLLEILKTHPGIQQTMKLYTSDPNPVFPAPDENIPSTTSTHSLAVLLLIFIWGVFAVSYSLSPIFRKSLFRYLVGHRFYVEDIMQRHIRSMAPAGIMLLQHAFLAGIAVYCFINATFSDLGIEALSFHLPVSILEENFVISVALGSFLITLAIEGICLLWLLLANPKIRQMAQAVNLYAWPLQLNLFIVTGMVTLLAAGSGAVVTSILGVLFLVIFLGSFVITSFDTVKYVKRKNWYILGTVIVYTIAWAAIFIWILNNSYLMDVYKLALRLS